MSSGQGVAGTNTPRAVTANNQQVGGTHYMHKKIQPWDFITANNIPFLEGNAIKYLCRWRVKGGLDDLYKVQHYVSKLIELESERLEIEMVKELSTDPSQNARSPTLGIIAGQYGQHAKRTMDKVRLQTTAPGAQSGPWYKRLWVMMSSRQVRITTRGE